MIAKIASSTCFESEKVTRKITFLNTQKVLIRRVARVQESGEIHLHAGNACLVEGNSTGLIA